LKQDRYFLFPFSAYLRKCSVLQLINHHQAAARAHHLTLHPQNYYLHPNLQVQSIQSKPVFYHNHHHLTIHSTLQAVTTSPTKAALQSAHF
jgi:hypothetical protein